MCRILSGSARIDTGTLRTLPPLKKWNTARNDINIHLIVHQNDSNGQNDHRQNKSRGAASVQRLDLTVNS